MTMFLVSSVSRLAVRGRHLDLAGRRDAADALDAVDLVLLEQVVDALDVAVDAFVLELHHRGEVERRLTDLDAHLGEHVPGFLEQLGSMQQRLRRDAADVEAGAAEGLALLDHRHLHAELRRADGADIAAGAGADDDEVVGHGVEVTPRRMAQAIAIGQLFDFLRLDENTGRIGAEVDLVPDIIQVPSEGVAMLADRDGVEIGLVLQPRECRPARDQLGKVVFAGETVIERDAQDRVAHDFDAFDPVFHSSILPP